MNKTNMRRLVRHLVSRKRAVGFDMRTYFRHNSSRLHRPSAIIRAAETHACGTVACIAGHAALLAWLDGAPRRSGVSVHRVAHDWLRLDFMESYDLFMGRWTGKRIHDITVKDAVAELRRMIAVG